MAVAPLVLIANPGSASRKYALYSGRQVRAQLHFEHAGGAIVCSLEQGGKRQAVEADVTDLADAAARVVALLQTYGSLGEQERITQVGLRIVAPTSFFLADHVIDDHFVQELEAARARAPLHIEASLQELHTLRAAFTHTSIIGVSDSAFHLTKPDYAWNYGLPLQDADRFDIKRFGYHGLSIAGVVHTLRRIGKLPPKLIVCHLGSGASVSAVHAGKSIDTTMGYSPLEGVVMATRTGSIDPTAVKALQNLCGMDDDELQTYLNTRSGLLGLSGTSSDIRELLQAETKGDHYAHLALQTYVYSVQKAIGQMTAALGGADMLVFTGTVGERSAPVRDRIVRPLHYLDLLLDQQANAACLDPLEPTSIGRLAHSKPLFVVPADETGEMVRHIHALTAA